MERRQHARNRSAQLLRSISRDLGLAIAAAVLAFAFGPVDMAAAETTCPPLGPCVESDPFEQTVTVGETAVFEASGSRYKTVQWQVSSDGGNSWEADTRPTDLGSNTEKLAVTATTVAQNGWKYRAVFKDAAELEAKSMAARLTVNVPPALTAQPVNQTVTTGEAATFTAAASGRPAPTAQWQVSADGGRTFANDTTDPGNTSGTLTLASTSVAQNGYEYRAVFKNAAGTKPSAPATLTVVSPIPPAASFAWFPPFPYTGQPVSLASNSTDPISPITGFAWDLGGTGAFAGGGPVLTTSFSSPGGHLVRLRVADARGLSSVVAETIPVTLPPPVPMQPFPIVRLVASNVFFGVRLIQLTVLAPVGARITVTCHGHGCPVKRQVRRALPRRHSKHRTTTVLVAFPRFERALLRPGIVLEIRVWKAGEIGKYTKFVIRRGRLPTRLDQCLDPSNSRPIACPPS
jgi:hypothetical protein